MTGGRLVPRSFRGKVRAASLRGGVAQPRVVVDPADPVQLVDDGIAAGGRGPGGALHGGIVHGGNLPRGAAVVALVAAALLAVSAAVVGAGVGLHRPPPTTRQMTSSFSPSA